MTKKSLLAIFYIALASAIIATAFWWTAEGRSSGSAMTAAVTFQAFVPNTGAAFPPRRLSDKAQDITFRVPSFDADKVAALGAKDKRNITVTVTVR